MLGPVAPYKPAPSTAQLARIRALQDAAQDAMVNGAFCFRGRLGQAHGDDLASWIAPKDGLCYIEGYQEAVRQLYGDDWQTCEIGWKPAVKIPGVEE